MAAYLGIDRNRPREWSPEVRLQWDRFVKMAKEYKVWDHLDHEALHEVFCSQIESGETFEGAATLVRDMVTQRFFYNRATVKVDSRVVGGDI